MAGGHPGGADTGHGSQRQRDRWRNRQVPNHRLPAAHLGYVGSPGHLYGLHGSAAAHAVDETHVGKPQLGGQALCLEPFADDRRVSGTATYREVVSRKNHRAAVDLRGAEHEVGGSELVEIAVVVILSDAGQGADLLERAGIADGGDPLADRQLVEFVLARDLLGATHLVGELLALAQLTNFFLPAHVVGFRLRWTTPHAAGSLGFGSVRRGFR